MKRFLTASLAALCLVPAVAAASELSDTAAAMAPGSWAALENMQGWNQGGILSPTELGCGTGDYITQFAEKAAWDPVHQRLLFVGQAHGNCYGGRFVIYDEASNGWSEGPWMPGVCQSGTATEPCFSHAYGHNTADPATGIFYFRQAYTLEFFRYQGNAWSSIPAPKMQSSQCCGSLEFFPDFGKLVFIDSDWGVHAYDSGQNQWVQLANTSAEDAEPGLPNVPMPLSNFAQYNPVKQVLLFGGGSKLYTLDAQGNFATKSAPPIDLGVTQAVLSVDPVTGAYIVLSGTTMYQYDVGADSWMTLSTPIPSPLDALTGVQDGLIQTPIPALGVIAYVKYDFTSSAVMLYKHAAPPPCENDRDCTAAGACQSAACDTSSGTCSLSSLPDGSACPDGSCHAGVCVPASGTGGASAGSGGASSGGQSSGGQSSGSGGSSNGGVGGNPAAGGDTDSDGGCSTTRSPGRGLPSAVFAMLAGAWLLRRRRTLALLPILCTFGCSADGDSEAAPDGGSGGQATGGQSTGGQATGGQATGGSSSGGAPSGGGSGGVGPPGDFATRCAGPGVIRCVGFDAASEIAGEWGIDPTGSMSGDATPEIDPSVMASGTGSLKFTIPASSGADTSGSYFANFSDDLSVQFDSGDEFWVQWRQRFDPTFATAEFAGGGGWKQAIIGEGSRAGDPVASCTSLELVTFNAYQAGFPRLYHSCGFKDSQYEPIQPPMDGGNDFALQNAISGCTYLNPNVPPCMGYQSDAWMTFTVHIQIGTWYQNDGNYAHDSTVQLWVANEGEASKLVVDMSPGDAGCAAEQSSLPECHTGYDLGNDAVGKAKYGQVWLVPYNTDKDPGTTYPESYTWYDELIVSKNPIPDPLP
jgi:hypothetical protein